MHRIFCLIASLLGALLAPLAAVAETLPITELPRLITGSMRVPAGSRVRSTGSVITESGSLSLEEGSVVTFSPFSRLSVRGALIIAGSEARPVSLQGDALWGGVQAEGAAELSLRYARIAGTQALNQLHARVLAIDHLDISGSGAVGAEVSTLDPEVLVTDIRFSATGPASVQALRVMAYPGQSVRFVNVVFADPVIPERMPRQTLEVLGAATYVELKPSRLGACLFAQQGAITAAGLTYATDYSDCVRPPRVLFIPGFGTSMNLAALATAGPEERPSQKGWQFIDALVPSYLLLVRRLARAGVTVATAFYDWRLTPEQAAERYAYPRFLEVAGSDPLVILTHSYGGLVARALLAQHPEAHKSVRELIQIAPPNAGAAKAYAVWQGGVIPKDWQAIEHLIRIYQLQRPAEPRIETIRALFPAVQALQPAYPESVKRDGEWLEGPSLQAVNPVLAELPEPSVPTTVVYADGLATPEKTYVRTFTGGGGLWPSGEPYLTRSGPGDGTVPVASAPLADREQVRLGGNHMGVVSQAIPWLVNRLQASRDSASPQVADPKTLTLVLDCPVDVRVVLPDGSMVDEANAADRLSGAALTDGETHWLTLAEMDGTYQVTVAARAATPVRYWVDADTPRAFSLESGDVATLAITRKDGRTSYRQPVITKRVTISPSPSPPISLAVTPVPSRVASPSTPAIIPAGDLAPPVIARYLPVLYPPRIAIAAFARLLRRLLD